MIFSKRSVFISDYLAHRIMFKNSNTCFLHDSANLAYVGCLEPAKNMSGQFVGPRFFDVEGNNNHGKLFKIYGILRFIPPNIN